ncbi:dormancy-associated protein homolog 4-like [Momordica charantia]|uniref:Dormancy-associated protein homolog 4-like n=1 Tax=Momordica charantia TaxID=3673 RepID=A0A6J1C649_MOMCH|nr:dormancy-associated protein homolog 4-like [Momordica charantia]
MSFLQKIWDETLAGPAPDSGLGRLRKYNSFSASRSPPMLSGDVISIPRSIDIPSPTLSHSLSQSRSQSRSFPDPASPISSPSPSTPPETPRGDDVKRLTKRRSVDFPRRRPLEGAEPTTPSVYDWIVITALDR